MFLVQFSAGQSNIGVPFGGDNTEFAPISFESFFFITMHETFIELMCPDPFANVRLNSITGQKTS